MEQYIAPNIEEVYINADTNEVKTHEELTHYQKMKLAAEEMKITLVEPNKNCKKNGCYGRGYIGFDTNGFPVPCMCVFPKKTPSEMQEETNKLKKGIPLAYCTAKQRRKFKLEQRKELSKKLGKEGVMDELKRAFIADKMNKGEKVKDVSKEEIIDQIQESI